MKKPKAKKPTTPKKPAASKQPKDQVPVEAVIMQASWARRRHRLWPRFDLGFVVVVGILLMLGLLGHDYVSADNQRNARLQQNAISLSNQATETHHFYTEQLKPLINDLQQFEASQTQADLTVVDPSDISIQLAAIKVDLTKNDLHKASAGTVALRQNLVVWQKSLSDKIKQRSLAATAAATVAKPVVATARQFNVPILVYHQTPSDFEQQLLSLRQKGYTAITFDQLTAAWNGAALPAKPVIITFDDGYANQMTAFDLLQKYQMHATFYIIDGGPLSDWCIGAGRQYNLPSQPAGGCGDAYLTWDQVRQLDKSGLITIGSHTIDHPDLPTETADQQRDEIIGGKTQLESQLGHSVYTFAYPYGAYNATTVAIVQQAGFTTAVTTTGGTLQSAANRFILDRVYNAYALP